MRKMKMKKFMKLIFLVSCAVLILMSCSSIKHYNDAVRIKPEATQKYQKNPFTEETRNANTLRGTVVRVLEIITPIDCNYSGMDTLRFIEFIDSANISDDQIETIPLNDVILIGKVMNWDYNNEHNNYNIFETYNKVENIETIREVPVKSFVNDTCKKTCDCGKLRLPDIAIDISIDCIKREFQWYFIELRCAYSTYTDFKTSENEINRENWSGEIAFGLRLGAKREWGIGLAFNYGLRAYNSFSALDYIRPLGLLHIRYQSPNDKFFGMCMRPFAYVQGGIPVDAMSRVLFKTECADCSTKVVSVYPEAKLGLPISGGLGLGLDIPVTKFMDISFDIGFRSLAFGEELNDFGGYSNIPNLRRINMLILRGGFTF